MRLVGAWTVTAVLATLLLSACGESNQYVAPPPPKVTVALPLQQPVTQYLEATGNTATVNTTDLVARVAGFIEAINYQDGDPGQKRHAAVHDRARILQGEARAGESRTGQRRGDPETAAGRRTSGKPSCSRNRRRPRRATILRWRRAIWRRRASTRPRPIRGWRRSTTTTRRSPRRSTASSRRGRSRSASMSAARRRRRCSRRSSSSTRSTSTSTSASRTCCVIRAEIARRGMTAEDLKKIPVEVGLQTETGYPHRGTLDYAAPAVTQSTGTLAGARHPAESQSGVAARLFRARAGSARAGEDALLVPETALGSDQGGRYVLIVNKDNVVEQRKVEIGPLVDTMRVIESGLTAGRSGDRQRPAARGSGREGRSADASRSPPGRRALKGRRMIAKFFIERPVLANVIAILMVVIGAGRALPAAGRAISRRGAAHGAGHDPLSRRERAHGHRHRRAADRAAGQRRRGHDLHAVLRRRRRHLYAHRDVQDRHRPQLRAGAGAEPRVERAVVAAAVRADAGRQRAEALDGDPADRDADVARRALRQPVSQQLRHHPPQGRDRAPQRRRQRHRVRGRPILDAGLARSEQDAVARADHAGCRPRRCSSRARRWPPARSARRRRRTASRSSTRSMCSAGSTIPGNSPM